MEINDVFLPVRDHLDEFEKAFSDLLHSNIPLVDQIVRYIATKRGKRLRPLLVLLSARLHGQITKKTLQAGMVVEMLHTATLVHDDVVDESELRRGSPTINNMWDNKISILIGDFLFSKTLSSVLDMRDYDALSILAETAKEITEGELLQIERGNDINMGKDIYFDLVSKKTASLISASCELGALSVNGSKEDLKRMHDFGMNLGIAFQIQDDLLDYIGDSSVLGKPTGNDIRENKVTLPLILSLPSSDEEEQNRILSMFEQGIENDSQVADVIRFVGNNGGVEKSREIANQYMDKAIGILSEYPDSDKLNDLKNLVQYLIRREK